MLTPAQLQRINKHLRTDNWLINNDLVAELTDHYADALTAKLAEGISFEVALQDVHRSFGGRKGLLAMEENYVHTKARTNGRVYRKAFAGAFRGVRLGQTGLLWLVVYALLSTLPIEQISAHINRAVGGLNAVAFSGLMVALLAAYVYAWVRMYRELANGSFSLHGSSGAVQVVLQSVAVVCYLTVFLPVHHLLTTYPLLASVAITLFCVHEWASIQMLSVSLRRKQLA